MDLRVAEMLLRCPGVKHNKHISLIWHQVDPHILGDPDQAWTVETNTFFKNKNILLISVSFTGFCGPPRPNIHKTGLSFTLWLWFCHISKWGSLKCCDTTRRGSPMCCDMTPCLKMFCTAHHRVEPVRLLPDNIICSSA